MSDGDNADAAAFCRRIRPALVGTLSLYCGDAHVAEELAQDVLATVWDRWVEVRVMTAPEAWAYRVGFNLASSHYRRRAAERRARGRRELPRLAADEPDPADAVAVRHAVAALPQRQRAVVVLRYFSDLSVADTANLLGIAPGTVKALTHQAVPKLRVSIGAGELEVASDGT